MLERANVGVLVDSFSEEAYRCAADRLRELLEDPTTKARCRRVAEEQFSLDRGIHDYYTLYETLASGLARRA
jgi:hypothetical protein